jgi:ribosome-associated protein
MSEKREQKTGIEARNLSNSKGITLQVCQAIAEKKGKQIVMIELAGVSLITDYFIVCSGNSRTQTQAIADNVEEKMKKAGFSLGRREGYAEGRWILLDYGVVIVHIFQEEDRQFYNLERLWGDAPKINYHGSN